MKRWIWMLCTVVLLCGGCRTETPPKTEASPEPTIVADETDVVKAVWIPFMEVNDLLASGDVAAVKTAIGDCLDDCRDKGFNTVYFHVRANSDAYYDSTVFTPHQKVAVLLGQGFDPLRFVIDQAHARGLSLHAWVNPYRIGADATFARCEDVFEYGGKWYYDPSSEQAQALIVDGVRELVEKYAVDGVQFDDYFYPGGAVSDDAPAAFEATRYAVYQSGGGALSVADWRRLQVSSLVSSVYAVCHSRPSCVFGISPAYHIDTVRDTMYADVEEWAQTAGYVDYLCPQIYFGFRHQTASFESSLMPWQHLKRHDDVALYVGLAMYKTGLSEDTYAGYGKTEWRDGGDIIARQVRLARQYALDGVAVYSHQSFAVTDGRDATVIDAETNALCVALAEWQ